jgi:Amt family ammonium transporter
MPLGLLLLIWGGLSPRKARRVAPLAALTMALGVMGYWATGFAFHLGGAQTVSPDAAGLSGLRALFSFVPGNPNWGVVGLTGFFLMGPDLTSMAVGLFLEYLPVVISAIMVLTLALSERRRWTMILAGSACGAVIVPVAACWMWGGGWLARLGETLSLGHGVVDFGGTLPVLWLPGMVALGFLAVQPKRDRPQIPEPPQTYGPMLANVGAFLIALGWMGWSLSQPFHLTGTRLDWNRSGLNVVLGMAGAVLTSQLYAWLSVGAPGALLAAQGLAAGWGTALAGAPFIPPWAAFGLGLISGLAYPMLRHAFHAWLRHSSGAATVALALTSGPLGMLGIGFLADGRWGQGFNGIAPYVAGETTGQGVAGLFVRGDAQQLIAQGVGLAALGVWGLAWGLVMGIVTRPRSAVRSLAKQLASNRTKADSAATASAEKPQDVVTEADPAAEEAPADTEEAESEEAHDIESSQDFETPAIENKEEAADETVVVREDSS